MSEPFIGEIRLFSGPYCPVGWIACDGATWPTSMYPLLHRVIGYTYGGNEFRKLFAVPNLCGHAAVGSNQIYPFSSTKGEEMVTLRAENLPYHSHSMSRKSPVSPTSKGNVPSASANIGVLAEASSNKPMMMMADGIAQRSTLDTRTIGVTGGVAGGSRTAPHENRQPFLSLVYAIAWEGVPPI